MSPSLPWLAAILAWLLLVPAAWADPAGPCPADGNLDYYRCRARDFARREPGAAPPDYYLGYGDRYVRRFTLEARELLSPAGQAWLDRVRTGLQEAIERERARDPVAFAALERDPQRFLDFAYGTHPEAYLEAGLRELTVRDLLIVASTPDLQDLITPRGLRQVVAVLHGLLAECRAEGVGSCLLTRVLRELRERRRLLLERLQLRSSGTLGGWVVQRWIGSALRALGVGPDSAGLAGRLELAGQGAAAAGP